MIKNIKYYTILVFNLILVLFLIGCRANLGNLFDLY